MKEFLLAEYSLKLKPLYGPFHREMLNLSWLLEAIRSSLRSGYFVFQSSQGFEFTPVLEGKLEGAIPDSFELVSFFNTMDNFIIDAFGLKEKHKFPLYSDAPFWVNIENINFNIREFFRKLLDFEISGLVSVINRIKLIKGYIMIQRGEIIKVFYGEDTGGTALRKLIEDLSENVCIINVYELPVNLISFLVLDYEFMETYSSLESISFDEVEKTTMVVSVSPERYGYKVYQNGKEALSVGFEEEAPYFELLVSEQDSVEVEPLDPFILLQEDKRIKTLKYDPEHPILYFCPACWSVVSRHDKTCPHCGYDLMEFHNLPYEYKLIMALEHPVKEMKKNVIYTVGKKDLEIAIPHLEVMIARETDPLVLMEIADALSRMSSSKAVELLRSLAQHPYTVVRSRANMHLYKRLKHVDEQL
ncbi:MAG: HEAT repeat domain-containing protein [Aquificaceae bacterium]|nr:HEAT repeat domain-containing protein [Aquificaceae bacterium]